MATAVEVAAHCRTMSTSGASRGELYNALPLRAAYNKKSLGIHRGLIHSSQSTEPQLGQLHLRKRAMHALHKNTIAGASQYRPAILSWAYLIPSLRSNIEAALPDAVYEKLKDCIEEGELTGAELQCLRTAQHLLRYELHQRLELLEDSFAEAELTFLVQWPRLFQRAWVRLPLPVTKLSHAQQSASCELGSSALSTAGPTSLLPTSLNDWVSPTAHHSATTEPLIAPSKGSSALQATEFKERLAQLFSYVVEAVEEDLDALQNSPTPVKSRRERAKEVKWRSEWSSTLKWHASPL